MLLLGYSQIFDVCINQAVGQSFLMIVSLGFIEDNEVVYRPRPTNWWARLFVPKLFLYMSKISGKIQPPPAEHQMLKVK